MQRAQHVETSSPAVTRTFGPGRSVSGLEFERYFSKDGVDPFDEIEWELRSARHRQRDAASWCSSSATSSSRSSGRSRRPTSSSRSISAGRSARRSASAR